MNKPQNQRVFSCQYPLPLRLCLHLLLAALSATGLARTIALDGSWEIAFDREHAWKLEDGSIDLDAAANAWQPAMLPSVWELIEPDYDGIAWYRNRFPTPSRNGSDRIRIRFHAVNYFAEAWLNGTYLGSHEGGYAPFEFEVTDPLVQKGVNQLLVRVLDPGIQERIDGFFLGGLDRSKKDLEIPQGKERRYGLNFGGIWQPVELVITDAVYLDDVFVVPRLNDRCVEFQVQTDGPIDGCTVEFLVNACRQPNEPPTRHVERLHFASPGGKGFLRAVVSIDQPHLWSPADPFLYQAGISLFRDGALCDRRPVRFGMREFTYRQGTFLLNGKPLLLKGGLTQGFYPITLAAAETPEMIRNEIRLAKEANLNLLRLHLKPHPPEVYNIADELGILIYAEPAIGWMVETPELRARCERELREMILRDRNHPSVVIWGILNEGSRGGGALATDLAGLAQQIDPTRVIIADSGKGGSILVPFQSEPVSGFQDQHEFTRFPVDDRQFRKLNSTKGLVSQTGYGGLFDLPRVLADYEVRRLRPDLLDYREYRRQLRVVEQGFQESNLAEVFRSPRELLLATQKMEAGAARFQTEARRLSPDLSGIIHCVVGNAWEYCGMLDVWRERKTAYAAIAEAFEPDHLVVWSSLRNGYLGEPMPLEIYFVSETGLHGPTSLALQVEDGNGSLVWEKETEIEIEGKVERLLAVHPVITGRNEGEFSLLARLNHDGETVTGTRYEFNLLLRDKNAAPTAPVGIPSSTATWQSQAEQLSVKLVAADPEAATPTVFLFAGRTALDDAVRFLPEVKDHGKTAVILLETQADEMELFSVPSDATEAQGLAWLRRLRAEPSTGADIGYYHYVRSHRIFQRLPQRRLMGQAYRNVCARMSLVGEFPAATEVIVGAFTTTWGEFRWSNGVDLAVVPYGSGRIIFSTLQLTPHLGQDSFADVVFLNLLRFACGG